MKDLTPAEVEMAYNMCGRAIMDADFATDVFNALKRKGNLFNLKEAVTIKVKHWNKPPKFKPNSNAFRTFFRNHRRIY